MCVRWAQWPKGSLGLGFIVCPVNQVSIEIKTSWYSISLWLEPYWQNLSQLKHDVAITLFQHKVWEEYNISWGDSNRDEKQRFLVSDNLRYILKYWSEEHNFTFCTTPFQNTKIIFFSFRLHFGNTSGRVPHFLFMNIIKAVTYSQHVSIDLTAQ